MRLAKLEPPPCMAYPPATVSGSRVLTYRSISCRESFRNHTFVSIARTTVFPVFVSTIANPVIRLWRFPLNWPKILFASERLAGFPITRPRNTASVSAATISALECRTATVRAFSSARFLASVIGGSFLLMSSSCPLTSTTNETPALFKSYFRHGDAEARIIFLIGNDYITASSVLYQGQLVNICSLIDLSGDD